MFLRIRFVMLAIVLPCIFFACGKDDPDVPYDVVIDFQDVIIPNGQYLNDAGSSGFFQTGIASFQNTNVYDEEWDYSWWYGFAYSQMHDVSTAGYENEYSAYVLNDPPDNKFMVGYYAPWEGPSIEITFSQPVKDLSFEVANTTWAALAMKDGDYFTEKFVDDSDWFKLTIKATATEGIETITINLGEGVKISNTWNTIVFQSENITKLEFSLDSSNDGVPTYFCIDNIKARTVK